MKNSTQNKFSAILFTILVAVPVFALPNGGLWSQELSTLNQIAIQQPANGSITRKLTVDSLPPLRQALARRINSLRSAVASLETIPSNQWLLDSYQFEIKQVQYLDLLYSQIEDILSNPGSAIPEHDDLGTEFQRIYDRQLIQPKVTFSDLEHLRGVIDKQRNRVATIEAEASAAQSLKQLLANRRETIARQRRQLEEAFDEDDTSVEMKRLARQLIVTRLSVSINEVSLEKVGLDAEKRRLDLEKAQSRLATLEQTLSTMPSYVVFTQSELEQQYQRILTLEEDARAQLTENQTEQQCFEDEFQAATGIEALSTEDRAELLAIAEHVRESLRTQSAYLNAILREFVVARFCWQARFEIAQGAATEETLSSARNLVDTFEIRLENAKQVVHMHLEECRGSTVEIENRLQQLSQQESPSEILTSWLETQIEYEEMLERAASSRLNHIASMRQLIGRLDSELKTLDGNARDTGPLVQVSASLIKWWGFELFAVDDKPITVGKLLLAALLLILGLLVGRWISRLLGSRMLPRLGIQSGGSLALQTIIFYGFCLAFAFFTLELLNIPLTVFAFLGGAAAIAIGFGSQTLLNNFISGLILLGEQPVRVGDLVEIDGVQGNIKHIGARSTKIQTGENHEIILPNSKFMEQRLTNWTLANSQIRTAIKVGVAYGSPIEQILDLLRLALDQVPEVNSYPEPILLLSDFGNSALQFEAHFWINIQKPMDARKVESLVRRRIDIVFRQHNIVIAFPQQDVHLDVTQPIQVSWQPHAANSDHSRAALPMPDPSAGLREAA